MGGQAAGIGELRSVFGTISVMWENKHNGNYWESIDISVIFMC
jgi:hypothetical protein